MTEGTCRICGDPLGPRKRSLCSSDCARVAETNAARDKRRANRAESGQCRECRAPFDLNGRGRQRRFCNDACKLRFHSRVRRRRLHGLGTTRWLACAECGGWFSSNRVNAVYCSRGCYRRGNRRRPKFAPESRLCANCGDSFTTIRHDQRFCCVRCQRRSHARSRQRALVRPPSRATYSDIEIFERDKWRCHICGSAVRRSASRLAPNGPTIDHLIPQSEGGLDIESNVALAHRSCNGRKNAGAANDQLRLAI